jgi:polyisoprenyl-phosphate glycosyltransferase
MHVIARPSKYAIVIGAAAFVISNLWLLLGLIAYLLGHVVPGWTSLLAAIVFLGSIQIILLAIVGEQVTLLLEAGGARTIIITETNRSRDAIGSDPP